jgi:predicted site-specific integrase-resolvase
MNTLLTPNEVDQLLRYRRGRAKRLARRGILPSIRLPDGEVRFDEAVIERIAAGESDPIDGKVVSDGEE